MRDRLAEHLIAEVMDWSDEDMARERPILQSLAAFKYDEYQKFIPGMRFIESFAIWLGQFDRREQREIAYRFIRERLIFRSTSEMNHFVEMAYHDTIRPRLITKVALENGWHQWEVSKVVQSEAFEIAQRKTLFLGLSDGARIDIFRRNNPQLSHEQIYLTYEIANKRAAKLLEELSDGLSDIAGAVSEGVKPLFETVVLIDDFSASGISYIREKETGVYSGKVASFYQSIVDAKNPVSNLIDPKQTEFYLLLYVATKQAIDYFHEQIPKMLGGADHFQILVVDQLDDSIRLAPDRNSPFNQLIEDHYDDRLQSRHTDIGGDDVKFGFNACGLPLILTHNTPNNSLALLWGESDRVKALFPRVSRHK